MSTNPILEEVWRIKDELAREAANAQILRRLQAEAKASGWQLPAVCTPPELMGDLLDDESNS